MTTKTQLEVENTVGRFRKDVTKIRNSDNPYYKAKDVQDYEIAKLRADLEQEMTEANALFTAQMEAQIPIAQKVAITSNFYVSEQMRQTVDHIVDEFIADAKLAVNEHARMQSFTDFEKKLDYLEPASLSHLRKQLPRILSSMDGLETIAPKLKGLNSALRELKTPEQTYLADLEAMAATGIDGSYRRLRMTHPAFSDDRNSMHNPLNSK